MLSVFGEDKQCRIFGDLPGGHLLRNRHLHIHAVHLLITLRALDVRSEDRGLDLRLDPLLQAALACVDEVVAGHGGIVVRELSCGATFQARVTWIGDRLDPLALGGGCHACDRLVGGVGECKFGRGARSGFGDRPRRCRRASSELEVRRMRLVASA
jgi:hypothetical protein